MDTPHEPQLHEPQLHERQPHEAPRRSGRRFAALTVAAMVAAGVGGYGLTQARQSAFPSTAQSRATTSSSKSSSTTKLTLAQIETAVDPALVDITSTLGNGTAAGTGMVVTSTGEILTNNHVVSGATSISVKVLATGTTYRATLVGYDVTDDVAVLQIPNVSGLTTITTASTPNVAVADAVVALGNAYGEGGTPAVAAGTVTAVGQTITASDETGAVPETLRGLIQFEASIAPGDSGGATVNAYGEVIGMTTAAASNGVQSMATTAETAGYAIPIESALSIAADIEAGHASSTVHIGEHGLLGVEVDGSSASGASAGVTVLGVQANSAAARAGIVAGDAITAISGRTTSTISDLDGTMAATHVGDTIAIRWEDTTGQAHEATVTINAGAA